MKMRFRKLLFAALLFSCSGINAQVNLNVGLVAHYPFTGNANDVSGNNNNGTVLNGAQLSTDRFGNANSAYLLDGVDDYINVTDNGGFSTPTMSLVVWFQTTSNALQVLVGKRKFLHDGSPSGGSQYQFFINYPPFPGIGSNLVGTNSTCTDAVNSSYINTNNWICANKWYLAVVTFDGSRHKIYIDGVLRVDVATPFPSMLPCNSDLRFGNWWSLDNLFFKGKLDDIRWYNRALNQDEVTALYGNFTGVGASSTDFSYTQDVCNPATVKFYNTPDIQNPTWYFGDGNTSNTVNPTHTYAVPGSYNVKVITNNSFGCQDSISKPVNLNLSNANAVLSRDTTICQGASVQLNTASSASFCWTNPTGLSSPSINNPVATPTQTTTYFFNSQQLGSNLVVNGDFSQGNTGFTSDYTQAFPNILEAQYWVDNNPTAWNGGLNACTEHTSGTGKMMMVNGSATIGAKVWSQTVNITPNTNYVFSVWVQSLAALNPANLRFSINNLVLGNNISAGAVACQWSSFYTVWNSGNSSTAVITIVNNNTVAAGNDFAIDDIFFSTTSLVYDSVKITVLPKPNIRTGNDTLICQGQQVQFNATGGSIYSWSPAAGLSNAGIANPQASPSATTQYIVSGYNDPGCIAKDTLMVTVVPQTVFTINPALTAVCSGDPLSISASGGDTYLWYSSSQPNLSTTNSYGFTPTRTDTFFVAIENTTCRVKDTLQSIVNLDNLPVTTVTKSNDLDCATPEAQLNATGGVSYQWSPATDISNPSIPDPIVSPLTDTWYKVTVTNFAGCKKRDSVLVRSNLTVGQNGFLVPNSFTPNSDGLNDCFGVRFWGRVDNFELSVYNRWGQRIFLTRSPQQCWDGTFKGVKQPIGTYVYQIKATSPCSPNPIYRKGHINLLK